MNDFMNVPVYEYSDYTNPRYIIKLYDYSEIKSDKYLNYTVCCMLGNNIYSDSSIVRLDSDKVYESPYIGKLPNKFVAQLIRNSYNKDLSWQHLLTTAIDDIADYHENIHETFVCKT